MRIKIVISAPAILATIFLVSGLVLLLFTYLVVDRGEFGNAFIISINPQTLSIYLLTLLFSSVLVFRLLKRKME